MSNLTAQIRDNFEALIGTTLGAEWNVLKNKYELEKNNFANQDKRFGVTIGSGAEAGEGILKHYTINRSFNVILLQKYIKSLNSDDKIASTIDALEDALDEVAKASINNKLSAPSIVLNVTIDSIEEPNFTDLENIVTIVATFNVTYRNRLN